MSLQVYNSLTRTKEIFEPIVPGRVGIYVCGPTVYGDSHLGHAKAYISFDVIVRYLRFLGYKVRYVQNITDVGHMTDNDEDQGEDKIAKKAALERIEPMEVVTHYMMSYFDDMAALNVQWPDIICLASGHIPEQIALIQRLLDAGVAYVSNGSVYFSVDQFSGYGKLSGRRVEELEEGARVAVNIEKRNPADFALWKKAEPGHLMVWDSPWGRGFPGWHLECSAMSMKYLGETFDIHGGGLENQFPHHECEIAQSEAATGKPFVRYWLHNNMLTINGQKMGKSLGNFVTIKEMLQRISPEALRLFVLMSHYRSVTDFSDEALNSAEKGMARLSAAVQALSQRLPGAPEGSADRETTAELAEIRRRFTVAMDDDFNTAEAVAQLFSLVRLANSVLSAPNPATRDTLERLMAEFRELGEGVLGLRLKERAAGSEDLTDQIMQVLIQVREKLRKEKQYAMADEIRQMLAEAGIVLKDEKGRTTWARL
ncbi:MAG: Cysteine--tRNA ligase [Candidatus Latescibacteria bacterium ADurb.Bin168]|nr:MAG: Cysteine--tRNA ligase [Candidatus Latescibacteria bacterium ADurb.Bin168]